jgi:hypothetical protein
MPRIEAIGVTDYYVTDTCEEFLRQKATGRLVEVKMIYPNIELRLDVAAKSGFVKYTPLRSVQTIPITSRK